MLLSQIKLHFYVVKFNLTQLTTRSKRSSNVTSSCRVWKSVGNSAHLKTFFGKVNRTFLIAAEEMYGISLQRRELLLHLLSRPCKRRLKIPVFKTLISESERSLIKLRDVWWSHARRFDRWRLRKQQTAQWRDFIVLFYLFISPLVNCKRK